jgi:DNA-binding SARP family transcriptional activator
VPADVLMEVLWDDAPPAGALQALQKQVSRLRHRFGEGSLLHHRPSGYALEIVPEAIDIQRLEELLNSARSALGQENPKRAAVDLQASLPMSRGAALADHRFDEFAHRTILPLEELSRSTPCAHTSCWRCTAQAGSRTISRRCGTDASCSPTSSESSRSRSCGASSS